MGSGRRRGHIHGLSEASAFDTGSRTSWMKPVEAARSGAFTLPRRLTAWFPEEPTTAGKAVGNAEKVGCGADDPVRRQPGPLNRAARMKIRVLTMALTQRWSLRHVWDRGNTFMMRKCYLREYPPRHLQTRHFSTFLNPVQQERSG